MTKEQKAIFDKLFSDFQTIKNFTIYELSASYCACNYDILKSDSIDVLYNVKQKIKEQYRSELGLWCSGKYLETLEHWYDYILYNCKD